VPPRRTGVFPGLAMAAALCYNKAKSPEHPRRNIP
jgi:hypothetical protein